MKKLALLLAVLAGAYAQQLAQSRRVALVIGNDAYLEGNRLQNAVSDARAMGAALREAGFAVQVVENATREGMETAVEEFIGKLERGDVALFYYSGHAVQIPHSILDSVRTMTANIAAELGEAPEHSEHYRVLFLTGVLLFLITFVVNLTADLVVRGIRKK